MTATVKTDIYTQVTNCIVAALEKGVRPWVQPWNSQHAAGRITRPKRHSGAFYAGINILILWGAATAQGYSCPTWMSYKQAQELGAQVRKGERGNQVVYATTYSRTDTAENGEETERAIPFLKTYTVFNCEQIDNLPAHYYALAESVIDPIQRIAHADAFFANLKADIRHGGNRAYYAMSTDHVQMPPFEAFRDALAYFATLGHECCHWSGAKSRLNRDLSGRFGSHAYATDELISEICSAFLCADLALTPEPRKDHAAYLASWLTVLKSDRRAIFTAAAHAERAAAYLHGLQPQAASPYSGVGESAAA
jgi:antirestriction protein ArdC